MLKNREIFKLLLKRCSYLWNDIHLALLTNFVMESQWLEGLRALYSSLAIHQLFTSMNLFEKEKYLSFCERSAISYGQTSPLRQSLLSDFRYSMSFEPYNAFYLPMLFPLEDLLQP
jgi:hypothetical protein